MTLGFDPKCKIARENPVLGHLARSLSRIRGLSRVGSRQTIAEGYGLDHYRFIEGRGNAKAHDLEQILY